MEDSTYSVSEALQNYFNSVEFMMKREPKSADAKAQLDYFLSRRFLITAYNNLKNLDPALHDHKEIKEKLSVLQGLHDTYNTVSDKASVPEVAFEMIFLRSQPEYIQYLKDKENWISRVEALATVTESLFYEIEKREGELKKLAKNDKNRILLENSIKPLRGDYVDAIHERAQLVEKLAQIKDLKAIYSEKYFDSFADELSKLSKEYKKVLVKILNTKASELDYEIWKHASKSKLVREHFSEAGIEGDYTTMTYLGYYLKTLDMKQLGDEHVELFKFFNYLSEQ
ncbi:hypothetical protein [Sulfurimonas sp.]|uniref:hypothetical protein n=1 Tax=Sulfurimonas sp. TaxID=2022749 RepID=UPI0025EA7A4C|nr:hypothetical protein [Sulfurimonas sp.]MBW6488919.1 hypothetical protein [Sulfurimonas sp.]